jgi:hypothetical protein
MPLREGGAGCATVEDSTGGAGVGTAVVEAHGTQTRPSAPWEPRLFTSANAFRLSFDHTEILYSTDTGTAGVYVVPVP